MRELLAITRALLATDHVGATLTTLVSVEGSSYRRPGARLLLLADGTRIGSISGGCLEEDVVTRAKRVAATGEPEVVVYDTTSENDLVWGVGLGCHGIVRLLIEPLPPRPAWAAALETAFRHRQTLTLAVAHGEAPAVQGTAVAEADLVSSATCFVQTVTPPPKLVIFGAGNDALPLTRLAQELGWTTTVCDPRPAFADPARFPAVDSVVAGPVESLVARAVLDRHSVAVVMTHHYIYDVPLLRDLLKGPAGYIGLLGPRKRAERILSDLIADGFELTDNQRARLHGPVGLDLGADGPEQVAVAIVAEILAFLNRHDARPLRQRTRPIHDDAPLPAGTAH